jgi:hypothetical protein
MRIASTYLLEVEEPFVRVDAPTAKRTTGRNGSATDIPGR